MILQRINKQTKKETDWRKHRKACSANTKRKTVKRVYRLSKNRPQDNKLFLEEKQEKIEK